MNALAKWRSLTEQAEQIQLQLSEIEKQDDFRHEVDFENKLFALMDKHNMDAAAVCLLLQPPQATALRSATAKAPKAAKVVKLAASQPAADRSHKKKPGPSKGFTRSEKTYRNPHTGETAVVTTANQRPVNLWRMEHGDDVVKQWLVTE